MMASNGESSILFWGPKEWRIFHKKALEFNAKPSEEQQKEFKKFYEETFKDRLPCNVCKVHYEEVLKKLPVKVESKRELFNWTTDVHNAINERLKKEKVEYSVSFHKWAAEKKSTDTLIKETPILTGAKFNCTGQVIDPEAAKKTVPIPNKNYISNAADPRITTSISMTTYLPDSTVSANAVLANCKDPTGTITFNVYEENKNCTGRQPEAGLIPCRGKPLFTSVAKVNGNETYTSKSFTFKTPGTYYWTAHYSGDKQNKSLNSPCGENKAL